MRHASFKILLLVSSAFVFAGCPKGLGPNVEVCVFDVERGGAHCVLPKKKGQKEGDPLYRPLAEIDNYVAFPASDFGKILDYAKKYCR